MGGSSGSIPACAGEPGEGDGGVNFGKVYPRVCGGTAATVLLAGVPLGLSPRVRGNRYVPGLMG